MAEPQSAPYVFISYASADRERVLPIVDALTRAGVPVWIDRAGIHGGANYGREIAEAIKGAAALVLMASSRSLASRNVKQEIAVAWEYERPYLPLLLEPVTIPDDLKYWLTAAQWVEVHGGTENGWLPSVMTALERLGVAAGTSRPASDALRRAGRAAPLPRLPIPPTPLVGRGRESAAVAALLRDADARIVTLTGPGGTGKTRLALAVANAVPASFADGVAFVPLATITDPELVLPAIAAALGVKVGASASLMAGLQAALAERQVLLVLDNCEQVAEAAPDVAALLAACPAVKVLATSRAALRLRGEREFPVPPLDVPDLNDLPDAAALAGYEAIRLFVERAKEFRPDFALTAENAGAVAAICARLDGLPLALELAAARVRLLTPSALLARLGNALPVLTGGARDLPERQRTLRDTIAWSYDLLAEGERALLRRLGVFAGGWTLEAATVVCEAEGAAGIGVELLDGLESLMAQSLVRRGDSPGGEPRFAMLETIREYALERLEESGEAGAVGDAHARYYRAHAERIGAALHGPDQVAWFDRLDAELPNLRAALTWLLARRDLASALRVANAIYWFWFVRGHLSEGRRWIARALDEPPAGDAPIPPVVSARAYYAASQLALFQGDLSAARALLTESELRCRALDRDAGDSGEARRLLTATLRATIQAREMSGDPSAGALVPEYLSLVSEMGDQRTDAEAGYNQGRRLLYGQRDGAAAEPHLLAASAIFRDLGDVWYMAHAVMDLGVVALLAGDASTARGRFAEALDAARTLKDRALEAFALNNLGESARLACDDAAAATYYDASLRRYRDLGSLGEVPRLVHNLGYLALHAGNVPLARARFVESLVGFRAVDHSRGVGEAIAGLAAVGAHAEAAAEVARAARLWGAAEAIRTAERAPLWPADSPEHLRYQAEARARLGDLFDAEWERGRVLTREYAVAEALAVDAVAPAAR